MNRKRRKRKAATFARCFHSVERVAFVKTLPSAASGRLGDAWNPMENAHVTDDGTKGMARRSGYACIAPLLRSEHRLLHRNPTMFAIIWPTFDADAAAQATERAWQEREKEAVSPW